VRADPIEVKAGSTIPGDALDGIRRWTGLSEAGSVVSQSQESD